MSEPPSRQPYDLNAIVDIAVRTFLKHGYDGTSMDQLARAADIRKASLYYHVSGKEELLRLGATRALDPSFAIFEEPGAKGPDPLTRLQFVIRRICENLAEHVPEAALMIRVRGNTDTERWVLGRRRELQTRVAGFVQDVIDAGQMSGGLDAVLTTRFMLGMITSAVDWYRAGGVLGPHELAERVGLIVFGAPFSPQTPGNGGRRKNKGEKSPKILRSPDLGRDQAPA